jgi:hypothetical protein
MQRATGQMARPDQFGKVRKDIARVKTVLGEKAGPKQRVRRDERDHENKAGSSADLTGRVVSNKMDKTVTVRSSAR